LHIESFDSHPGTFLLLDGARARWAFVNASGLEILDLCNGTLDLAEIAAALANRRGIPVEEALERAGTFLGNMVKAGLVYDGQAQPSEIATPLTRFSGLTIEVTKRCNLRCRHCYLAAGKQGKDELTCDEIKSLISAAKELGATFVNLSGGEPFLREDCFLLLEHIAASGLRCIIGTNGTTVSPRVARRLAELPVVIQVSLDGSSSATHDVVRGPGVFQLTLQGLNNLVQAGLSRRVILAFTPMACNMDEAAAPIDLALEKGLKGVIFTSLLAGGNAQTNWQDLQLSSERVLQLWEFIFTQARDLAERLVILHQGLYMSLDDPGVSKVLCSIGTNLRVDPEGNVYPCQCFVGGQDYRLGSVREQTLDEIVIGPRLQQVKRTRYQRIELIEQCRECVWRHYCGAGCMGNAYHKEGTIYTAPDCDLRRRWIKWLFELRLADLEKSARDREVMRRSTVRRKSPINISSAYRNNA
jgi:radical SAM protein with 4Fe4S-binding SPASM domain